MTSRTAMWSVLLVTAVCQLASVASQPVPFDIVDASVADIHKAFRTGNLTSVMLTKMYLQRISLLNPVLHCVLEVNPDALIIAAQKDAERKVAGGFIGGLHGIPILLKDNIGTADKMNTTAGSYALLYSIVKEDAPLVKRVRKKGAILLGKANLSQWANWRSFNSISGWTSRGGFTINPYNFQYNPSGSSSGSAACAAASLAAVTLGSETDGSIISPSDHCSCVGLKPTIGLVSRSGVIPISHSQDTVGPICRTVADAVAVLDAIYVDKFDPMDPATSICLKSIPKGGYGEYLKTDGLKGKRIGVLGFPFFTSKGKNAQIYPWQAPVYAAHLRTLKKLGAILIHNIKIPTIQKINNDGAEFKVLQFDFKQDLATYLQNLAYAPTGLTLAALIEYNKHNPLEDLARFDQGIWLVSENTTGYNSAEYKAIKARDAEITDIAFTKIFKKFNLDAYVAPTPNGAGSLSAKAGYPIINVPAGYAGKDQTDVPLDSPYGLGFYGVACSEGKLIEMAYAFEHATKVRKAPAYKGTLPDYVSSDGLSVQANIKVDITS